MPCLIPLLPKKPRIRVHIIEKYFGNLSTTFSFKDESTGVIMAKTAEGFLEQYNA